MEDGKKPRRRKYKAELVILWLPFYWVFLGCLHCSTKGRAYVEQPSPPSSSLSVLLTLSSLVIRDINEALAITTAGALHYSLWLPYFIPTHFVNTLY